LICMFHILCDARPGHDNAEMRITYRVLGLIALVMAFSLSPAQAVCISGKPSIQEEFDGSLYVVTGTEISETPVGDSPDPDTDFYAGTNYKIRIGETIKGPHKRLLTVFSENSTGRYPMDRGTSYLLFIDKIGGRLAVDNCGNSGPVKISEAAITAARAVAKHTPSWPQITEVTKAIYVADAHAVEAGLEFDVVGTDGQRLYAIKCHPGEYDARKYSGLVQCYVLPLYSNEGTGNLLDEATSEVADQNDRTKFLDNQVIGACGNYFEFGKSRNFLLRGMRITLTVIPTEFEFPSDFAPSVKSYYLTVSLTRAPEYTFANAMPIASFWAPEWFNGKDCPGEGTGIKQ